MSGASFRRLRFLVGFKERLHPSGLQVTLFGAGIMGFGGAACSVGFRLLTGLLHKFVANRFNYLYVTKQGRIVGAVSLHDIKNYLNAPELAKVVIAEDLLHGQFPPISIALQHLKRD